MPASFANRPVSLHIYPDRLVVAAEGNILCEHLRIIERSHQLSPRTIYDWRHYLAVVQRKPGALRNGAPFLELPPAFRQLQEHMLRKPGGDREMVDILALVLQHDEQAVLTAVELALAERVAVVDRGYRGHGETRTRVLICGTRRGLTPKAISETPSSPCSTPADTTSERSWPTSGLGLPG